MSLNVANIEFMRRRFEKPNSYYGPKGLAPQLSLLRIEQPLVNGKGLYEFNLKKEILNGSESNLRRNDLFICISIGLATRIEDAFKPDITVPDFSPVMADFTTSGSAVTVNVPGFATKDIFALYNGSVYISTGNTVNFEDLPTALFLKQQSDDVTISSSDKAIRNKVFDFENDLRSMAEEVVFAGTQDHKIRVTFPTYAAADYSPVQAKDANGDVTSNYQSKLIFLALGYRVVNGTNDDYKKDEKNPYAGCI